MSGIADKIVEDIRQLSPFEPREDEVGDLPNAYRIQAEVTETLLAERPWRRLCGYKIAFNRSSSLDYYGLSEPCYAPLFSDQIHASGASLPLEAFSELVVEPEIAVRLGTSLTGNESREALAAAIAAYLPAVELMDVRGAFAHNPSAAAAVAQRIHSEGAVLGRAMESGSQGLWPVKASMEVDGIRVGETAGAGPQDPVDAVAWLARRLAQDGRRLEAGMVVLTGAHLQGLAVRRRCGITAGLEPLGDVSIRIT